MVMLFSFFLLLKNDNGLTGEATTRGILPQRGKGGMDPATARRMTTLTEAKKGKS
jgi:hypothetical protein